MRSRAHLLSARRARLGIAFLAALLTLVSFSATNIALARFTRTASVGNNTFTTGTWVRRYYFHNNPTPPTGNTLAQFYLPMNSTVPTAGTLYNYDTNCTNNSPGRDLRRTNNGIDETRTCYVVNWTAATLTSPLTISGQATMVIWSATSSFRTGRAGNLTAGLVDYDVGAGTASLITSVSVTDANWQHGSSTWVRTTLTFPTATYTIPAGHRLEVRLVAATSSSGRMWVAHDTAAYQSYLQLP